MIFAVLRKTMYAENLIKAYPPATEQNLTARETYNDK